MGFCVATIALRCLFVMPETRTKKTSLESERLLRDVFVWNEVRSFFESGRGGAGFAVGTNAFEHIVGGVQMKALGE